MKERARADARELFALTGWPVQERWATIDSEAKRLLALEKLERDDQRWALRALHICGTVFAEPPPDSLVQLVSRVANIPELARSRVRNKAKWREAAQHKAANPQATARQIATAIRYDQWHTIQRWMGSTDWQDEVEWQRGMSK